MSNFEQSDKLTREISINVLRMQAKVEVMLDLQARILSHLAETNIADEKREINEMVQNKVHQVAQEILKLELLGTRSA